jgi:16S rRNA (guanine527-N7)-methyltransferase
MVTRETSISAGLSSLGLDAYQASVPKLARYADLLETEGRRLGLIGEREVGRIVPRHILESCALLPFVGEAASLIDVGPGAGLPGLPLCIAAGVPTVLIESRARAAGFLRGAMARLDLSGQVLQSPAELAGRGELRESAEAVVARALAPPGVALELTLPFAKPGGAVLLLVGPSAQGVRDDAARVAAILGGAPPAYHSVEVPGVLAGSWVMIVGKVVQTPERYPRRPGVPRRRPLGSDVTGVD